MYCNCSRKLIFLMAKSQIIRPEIHLGNRASSVNIRLRPG